MNEHHNKVEKQMGEDLAAYQLQNYKAEAIRVIVEKLRTLNEDERREVLKKALKEIESSLEVRKGGRTRKVAAAP